jgi:hypothetical protein
LVERCLNPIWNRDGADVAALADQIHHCPVPLAHLDLVDSHEEIALDSGWKTAVKRVRTFNVYSEDNPEGNICSRKALSCAFFAFFLVVSEWRHTCNPLKLKGCFGSSILVYVKF